MKNIKKIAFGALLLTAVVSPILASAQTYSVTLTSVNDVTDILGRVLGYLRVIFFALAGIFFIIAAYQYLTSQGSDDKVKSAKNLIIYAVVAIVIAIIAGSFVPVIANILGGR